MSMMHPGWRQSSGSGGHRRAECITAMGTLVAHHPGAITAPVAAICMYSDASCIRATQAGGALAPGYSNVNGIINSASARVRAA